MIHKLLVAEDDEDTRRLYRHLLCDGCTDRECVFAEDGRAAIIAYNAARAKGEPFDLLLLDVMMPRFNGFQVAEHVRFTCRDTETDIVIVTGDPDTWTNMRSSHVHAIEVWTKPLDATEFKRRISYLLERVPCRTDAAASAPLPQQQQGEATR